jgi:hypothetical protein
MKTLITDPKELKRVVVCKNNISNEEMKQFLYITKATSAIVHDELVVKRYDNPDIYDVSKELTQFDALSRNNTDLKKMAIIDDDFIMQTFIKKEVGEPFDISKIYAQMFAKSIEYFVITNKEGSPTFEEYNEMLKTINTAISKALGIEYHTEERTI